MNRCSWHSEQGLCSHGALHDRCPFCFSFLYSLAYSLGLIPNLQKYNLFQQPPNLLIQK